ncbi:MAG TPA: TIGR02281 family clan AA aspartic protease [Stellaceae bacterium]|nr:TIGR02281 family clan AA aspartic protease [Stellaceae bacterium]
MGHHLRRVTAQPDLPSPHLGKTLRFAWLSFGIGALFCIGGVLALTYDEGGKVLGAFITRPVPSAAAPAAATRAPKLASNMLIYHADSRGHFFVDGEINGAPMRFLVDTGATLVALTPDDARAAGIAHSSLRFSEVMTTAHGEARAALTTLRSVRLGQLSVEEVPAVVMEEPMAMSLLGMSFLKRLDAYTIRDGRLIIEW